VAVCFFGATFFFNGLLFFVAFFTVGLLLVVRLVVVCFLVADFFTAVCFFVAIVVSSFIITANGLGISEGGDFQHYC
jgi:hypothetical protein